MELVRLETLDGEPMANYINGSRLKLYHEPLTQEMLDRMHAAKTQKAQAELLKQKAKEEADERARAAKAKRLKAKMLTLSFKSEDEEDQFVEPFRLEINLLAQKATVSTHALIDSGADLNVISWEIWDAMGQPKLDPSKLRFIGFSQAESECLGSITFKVSIQDEPLYVKFYVATKGESVEHVILGRLWMLNTNCQLDWETRRYKVKVNNRNLTGSCVENQHFQVFQHESDTNITKARGNNDETIIRLTSIQSCNQIEWLVPENFLKAQGYGSGRTTFWVPKHTRSKCTVKVIPKKAKAVQAKATTYATTKADFNKDGFLFPFYKLKGFTTEALFCGYPRPQPIFQGHATLWSHFSTEHPRLQDLQGPRARHLPFKANNQYFNGGRRLMSHKAHQQQSRQVRYKCYSLF